MATIASLSSKTSSGVNENRVATLVILFGSGFGLAGRRPAEAFGKSGLLLRRHKTGNAFDKSPGRLDCFARAFGRNVRGGASLVVGNGFEIVAAAEEGPQLIVNARVVLHQPAKLALQAAMGFVHAPSVLEDQRLRRMKTGKVRGAAGSFIEVNAQHCVGLVQKLARLFEIGAGLFLHRSMPSARIAYISGMRGSL